MSDRSQFRNAARWLSMWLCFLSLPVWAGDWRDTLSSPRNGRFPASRTYHAVYRFGWSGVTAAEATFDLTKTPRSQFQLSMKTKTIGMVRGLWRMDSQHTALCQVSTLRPISLEQTEVYKDETETSQVTFSPDEVRRITKVTPHKGPTEKEKRLKLPNVLDLQSALFYMRSQRLEVGESYRFIVYPSTSPYLAEIDVVGREKLKLAAGSYDAIKCRVRLQSITKKFELAPHKKFKRAYAWMSDDRDRLLLKIEAEIFVGSVWAELQSVDFEPKP